MTSKDLTKRVKQRRLYLSDWTTGTGKVGYSFDKITRDDALDGNSGCDENF